MTSTDCQIGELVEGLTVADVAGFRGNVDAETPDDNALQTQQSNNH